MTKFRDSLEELRADLAEQLVGRLAGDELDVIGVVVERLQLGREIYGQLDVATDGRDFRAEARDEGIDRLIYEAAEALRLARRPAVVITGDIDDWDIGGEG